MNSRVAGVLVLAVAALAACSGDPSTPAAVACTNATLAGPSNDAAKALGANNFYRIDDVQCSGDWAVTSGLLATKDNPMVGAPRSFVFRQQGQSWAAQDKPAICGTNPITTTPPADAKIPAELFVAGCAAG